MKPRTSSKVKRTRKARVEKSTLPDEADSTLSDSGVKTLTHDTDKGFDLNNDSSGWDSGKQVGHKI